MAVIDNISLVVEQAQKILKEDFRNYVNERDFEVEVTNIASQINIVNITKEEIDNAIDQYLTIDKRISFIIFFTFFTVYRRLSYGNLLEFCNEYISNFLEYEITEHIKILSLYASTNNVNAYDTLIKRTDKLINKKDSKFANHAGVLNLYAELVCSYYERNLDLRDGDEDSLLIKKALKYIEQIINQQDYHKYHLNKGRLLILLGNYDAGEDEILHAINMLPLTHDRENRVKLYEQYLIKASFVHAYDLNDDKYKDLEKIKVSNYKLVALMTTLLGFLLGTINIFAETKEPASLALLMLAYLSLLLVLSGVILLGLSITFKEKKKSLFAYDISLMGIGIILFIITMLIIIL